MSYKEYERMRELENVWIPVAKIILFVGFVIVFTIAYI
jgi:hypothetical protein